MARHLATLLWPLGFGELPSAPFRAITAKANWITCLESTRKPQLFTLRGVNVQSLLSSTLFPVHQSLLCLAVSCQKPFLAMHHVRRGLFQDRLYFLGRFAKARIVKMFGRLVASQTLDLVATVAHLIHTTVVPLQVAPLLFHDQMVHSST